MKCLKHLENWFTYKMKSVKYVLSVEEGNGEQGDCFQTLTGGVNKEEALKICQIM